MDGMRWVPILKGCLCASLLLIVLILVIWWLLGRQEKESPSERRGEVRMSPSRPQGPGAMAEPKVAAVEAEGVAVEAESVVAEVESAAVEAEGVAAEVEAAGGEAVSGGWESIQGGEEPSGGWESLGGEESFAAKAEPGAGEPSAIQGEAPAEAEAAGGEAVSGGWESLGEEESFAAKAEEAPASPDDLTRIEGIGPKISGLLHEAGITTFAQLAATDVETLRQILVRAGRRFAMASPETWPEQAELAAKGAWDALKALQDQLKGGRRR